MAQFNLGPPPKSGDPAVDAWLTKLYQRVNGTSAAGGTGYTNGSGGTVAQATDKTTAVTLNKICGQITTKNSALASGARASFVVNNSLVTATDIPKAVVTSGGTANAYSVAVTAVAAGQFTITIKNETGGSLSEAPVISFAIIKASAS